MEKVDGKIMINSRHWPILWIEIIVQTNSNNIGKKN